MSKTTAVISNHNLDISSLEALAIDVSNRFKASIAFGYNRTYFINEKNELDYDYEYIETSVVRYKDEEIKHRLIDENFGARLFIKENGIEILNQVQSDDYLHKELIESSISIAFELEFSTKENDITAYIYSKTIDLWITDLLSWSFFQQMFYCKMEQEDANYLNDWRLENKKWIEKFGGNFMFVYSFEEESFRIHTILENDYLEDVTDIIQSEFPNNLVCISKYLASESYKNKPVYNQNYFGKLFTSKHCFAIENGIDFFPEKVAYPILFYDDFKDFDTKLNSNNYFDFIYNGDFIFEAENKNKVFQKNFKMERKKIEFPTLHNFFKIYYCFISGFKHYEDLSLFNDLTINQEVFLVLEPNNEFDKHAIAIFVDYSGNDEIEKRKLGFIPKDENYMISKLLDNKYDFKVFLTKINENDYYNENYNYTLQIELFFRTKNK